MAEGRGRHPLRRFTRPYALPYPLTCPVSLWESTTEDWRSRNLYRAMLPATGIVNHVNAFHHGPIRFRGKWTGLLGHGGVPASMESDTRYISVTETIQALAHEVQACERDPRRPWPRFPLAIFNDDGLMVGTEDLQSLEDGRSFYDAWSHEELREHAITHEIMSLVAYGNKRGQELTTAANALHEAGESDATPVAEYRELVDWMYEHMNRERLVGRLHHDPNLLQSIPPVRTTTMTEGAKTRHAARDWAVSVIVKSEIPCLVSVRNVTHDLLNQPLHQDTTAPVRIGASPTGRSVLHRVKIDSELYGDFTAHIDCTPEGQRDPAATLAITVNEPEPPPEEEDESGNTE